MIDLYASGHGLLTIGSRYKAAPLTVVAVLRKHGVTIHRPGQRPRILTDDERSELLERYAQGDVSLITLAREYGMGMDKIRGIVREAGIKVRRRGANAPGWKGGRIRHREGYIRVVRDPDDPLTSGEGRYVMEHRLAMARHLGRPLRRSETVHHINGVKDDNRIENLELRVSGHGNGIVLCCADCGSTNLREVALATAATPTP